MDLLRIFGRRSIRDPAALATFIDEQALALSQRSLDEYARGRAGAQADALLAESRFRTALERARWEAYPRALAMLSEMVEIELRPNAADKRDAVLRALTDLVLTRLDRRSMPQVMTASAWNAARGELARSLAGLARERPRTLDAIAAEHATYFLAVMPLDARLARDDFPALRNQLQTSLAATRARLVQDADLRSLADKLVAASPERPASAG